jgi:rod shape-determining protein MreC
MNGAADLGSKLTGRESPSRIRDLEQRVARLELERQQYQEQSLENARLRALLDLKESVPLPAVAATIISNSVRGASKTCLIDKGSRAGLEPDLAVVNTQGVVGRVWSVGPGVSKVQMLIDASSGIAVLDQRSRVQGVLVGRGDQVLELRYLSPLDDVEEGDLLLSSGQEGIYPKGLPVGVVAEVRREGGFQRTIKVVPRVEFNRLEEVLVITAAGQGIQEGEPEP